MNDGLGEGRDGFKILFLFCVSILGMIVLIIM